MPQWSDHALVRPLATSQDQAEQLPAGFLDRRFAGGDAAGVEVDQVLPAPRQFAARRTP